MTTISKHLRRNAVAYAALFVALSGTAWAAGKIGANDIKPDAVRSKHIRDEEVQSKDVGDDSLTAADIDEGSLLSGLNTIGVSENIVPTGCNPASGTPITCASMSLGPPNGSVLVIGTLTWHADAAGAAGECVLEVDGAIRARAVIGETESTTDSNHQNSATLVGTAGGSEQSVRLACSETESNLVIGRATLTSLIENR